jgi:sugar phosphate permease
MSTPTTQTEPRPEQPASLMQVEHKDDFINEVDHISDHGDKTSDNEGHGLDERELAKTIRKVDLIILPVMTIVLAFSFIDRTNMGLAAVAGMVTELGLKGNEFSISLLAYFPGYVVFVLPSNYILSKWSIRGWLTVLTVTFGIFTLAMGLIQNFASLVVMRFFLGICEAG